MRILLGANGFPFYAALSGPDHCTTPTRVGTPGHIRVTHPYRGTTTTMKKSDHQRRNTLSENVIRRNGFRGEGAPTRGGGVVDARAALRNRNLFPEGISRWGGMTR